MGTKKTVLLGMAIALGLIAYFWPGEMEPPTPQVAAVAPPPAALSPPLPVESVERYPITAVVEAPKDQAPPTAEENEARYRSALAGLFGEASLAAYFYPERMIQRFVATIDNLPRHDAPPKMMPVKPVGGPFEVERDGGGVHITPANAARYLKHVAFMASVEPRRLVDLYVGLYPVFQQAYRDLGYPNGFFNDRLVEAIDDLLATPEPAPPIALIQPKVLYTYADPALQARSAGQRILLRLGAENRAKVKLSLGAIRQELLSRSPAGR